MKYIILIFYLILSINFSTSAFPNNEIISRLQSEGNIIFIRHALAPGNGDPDNFDLKDCKTQRNLNERGINQSIKIGEFFTKNNIIALRPDEGISAINWKKIIGKKSKYNFKQNQLIRIK